MANVFKRPTSRFFTACYRDRNGVQKRISTKLTDESAAQRMANELERVERMAKEGSAGVFQLQTVVNKVSKEVNGESLPSPSIQAYLHNYLDMVKRTKAETTHERYENTVRLFLSHLGRVASQPVRNVSPAMVERFLHHRLDGGSAPKTAIVDIKTLGAAFKRAEKFGYLDRNPVPAVTLPKATSTEREMFTHDEIQKLVAAAPNLDWQTLIYLGAYLGARLSDCVAMTWDHVDAGEGFIIYTQKKTGAKLRVPMHGTLIAHLHHVSAKNADGPLCPSMFGKSPGGKHGLSEGFKRIVKRAGLDLMVVKGKGARNFAKRTFHSLRHGFTSRLANEGVPIGVSMKLVGHSSPEIHKNYTHYSKETLKKAIDSIPSLPAITPKPGSA